MLYGCNTAFSAETHWFVLILVSFPNIFGYSFVSGFWGMEFWVLGVGFMRLRFSFGWFGILGLGMG